MFAQGLTFPAKPDKAHFYTDEAALIEASERTPLDATAYLLLKEEKMPILVVTIRSLLDHNAAGYSVEQYARALFDAWGIGSKDRNYGMLLLVSRGDRKARIELGAAWGRTHDTQSKQIMDQLVIPQFKRGNFSLGILEGVRGLDAMARGLGLPTPKVPWWSPIVTLAAFGMIVALIVSLFRRGQRGWGWALIAGLGVVLLFMLRSSGSGGGSGGSFGGGSSGGGGATGSW